MHAPRGARALHPTCSANREKYLLDISVQEQKRVTLLEGQREPKKKKWRDGWESRGTTERRHGDRRRRKEGDVREELRLGGQMKWWVRNEVWKDSVLGIILFLVPLLRLFRKCRRRRMPILSWSLSFFLPVPAISSSFFLLWLLPPFPPPSSDFILSVAVSSRRLSLLPLLWPQWSRSLDWC